MCSKQQQQLALRPTTTSRGEGFDVKVASVRERSGLANASFRVYHSLSAGVVPFLWESAPGTPKRGAATKSGAAHAGGVTTMPPPISPPPSYQSLEHKGGRSGFPSRSTWPAGGIVQALLGIPGLAGGRATAGRADVRHRSVELVRDTLTGT